MSHHYSDIFIYVSLSPKTFTPGTIICVYYLLSRWQLHTILIPLRVWTTQMEKSKFICIRKNWTRRRRRKRIACMLWRPTHSPPWYRVYTLVYALVFNNMWASYRVCKQTIWTLTNRKCHDDFCESKLDVTCICESRSTYFNTCHNIMNF